VIVSADGALGTWVYSMLKSSLAGGKAGKIPLVTDTTSRSVFIKSTVYDANKILVPVLKNVWASGQNFQNVLYLVMITKSTL